MFMHPGELVATLRIAHGHMIHLPTRLVHAMATVVAVHDRSLVHCHYLGKVVERSQGEDGEEDDIMGGGRP